MIDWISQQVAHNISKWDNSIEAYYPEHLENWRDPVKHYRQLKNTWNHLDAVKLIAWNKFINKENQKVLDLGGGTGWLSSYLSNNKFIESILLIDSSEYLIEKMVNEIIILMEGDKTKINCVRGLFSPILVDDNYFDIVVSSAALHHAENLEDTLIEVNRVLKKNGLLFILNEIPYNNYKYILALVKQFIKIMIKTSLKNYSKISPSISSSGYLYDPFLGDRDYPDWFWKKAIINSGFVCIEKQITPLKPNRIINEGINLTHYICRKL